MSSNSSLVVAAAVAVAVVVYRMTRRKKEKEVSESVIRLMTRLAIEHKAVNLSQGFPNERPPKVLTLNAAGALLNGASVATAKKTAQYLESVLKDVDEKDSLNQYSFPFGAPFLREALERYYKRWYDLEMKAATEVTVVCGATEGFACCLRALCEPGDVVVFFQPFHELYPSQVKLFYLKARAVTLRVVNNAWTFDLKELENALRGATLLLFNSPHNPTGKVFTEKELEDIAFLARKNKVTVVTDEIYEHVRFEEENRHRSLFELLSKENAVLVNSISKTASATGWRVGWVVANEKRTSKIRAVHDQLVACVPTPLQFGVSALLDDDDDDKGEYFKTIGASYLEKRQIIVDALTRANFDTGPLPMGAYYVFADYTKVDKLKHFTSPVDAAMYLTTVVKVACVPGNNFYLEDGNKNKGDNYLRFAFVRSIDLLKQAASQLDQHFPST